MGNLHGSAKTAGGVGDFAGESGGVLAGFGLRGVAGDVAGVYVFAICADVGVAVVVGFVTGGVGVDFDVAFNLVAENLFGFDGVGGGVVRRFKIGKDVTGEAKFAVDTFGRIVKKSGYAAALGFVVGFAKVEILGIFGSKFCCSDGFAVIAESTTAVSIDYFYAIVGQAFFHPGGEDEQFGERRGAGGAVAAVEYVAKDALVAQAVAGELDVGGFGKKIGDVGSKDGLAAKKESATAEDEE